MKEITQEEFKAVSDAVSLLRDSVEGKISETDIDLKQINATLDAFEKKNQEALKEKTAEKQKTVDLEEKVKLMEKNLVDSSLTNKSNIVDKFAFKNSQEYKALNEYAKRGMEKLGLEFKDILRTDVGSQGGFTVPAEMANFILNEIQEISPVRQFARKLGPVDAKSLEIVIGIGIPEAPFEKELEEGDDSTPTYGLETLTAYAQQTTIPVSRDLLAFSKFDMTSEITSKANKAFAKTEGNKFLLGTGVKEPEGILVNSSVEKIDSISVGTLTMDDVILLSGETKQGYDESYFFNKKTLVALRVEKDGNNQYLWRIGGESMPSEINGFPYIIFQDMPNVANDAQPVGFGDLFEGYSILDSIQMSMIRDEFTPKKKRAIEFTFYRYLTGKVVMPEAIKLLNIKSS